MEKLEDIKVFMLCHREVEYGLIDNEIVTPLECGAAVTDNNVCKTKDNTGDNISEFNHFFTEDTGLYWIWKNVHAKYKGQMQYSRRFLDLENEDFDKIFSEHDAIIAKPMDLSQLYWIEGLTLEGQYRIAHNIKDLDMMESIVKELYPDYAKDYDKYIKNNSLIYYSNGFILKEKDYDEYCSMLFTVLCEWLKRMNIKTLTGLHEYVYSSVMEGIISNATMDTYHRSDIEYVLKYQSRIGGSLAERFFTLYAFRNFKNPLLLDYDKPEGNIL